MCYTGGPRCASGARGEVKRTLAAARTAKAAKDADPTPENVARANEASQTYFAARVDYAGTPAGRGELMMLIQKLQARGEDTSMQERVLEQGIERYQFQMRRNALTRRISPEGVRTESKEHAIKGRKMVLLSHALKQAREKSLDMAAVEETFRNPERVYPNGRYEGQWRVTGNGICLVGRPVGDGEFEVVTMYLDKVVTPPRADQMRTDEGREYAERYKTSGAAAR